MASGEQCGEKVWEIKPRSLLALQQMESVCCEIAGYPNAQVLVLMINLFNGSTIELEESRSGKGDCESFLR